VYTWTVWGTHERQEGVIKEKNGSAGQNDNSKQEREKGLQFAGKTPQPTSQVREGKWG